MKKSNYMSLVAGMVCLPLLISCGEFKEHVHNKDLENLKHPTQKKDVKLSENAMSNKEAGIKFLEENAKKPGVKVTSSGLQYIIEKEGTGKQPKSTDSVTVKYEGRTIDGKVFDSTDLHGGNPITFPLNQVIPGWTEGLQLIKEGGKIKLFIPSNLAYGSRGAGAAIPPDSTLIFDVELIKVGK